MRLIGIIENEKQGRQFSAFLTSKKIANQCEFSLNTDWGSEGYGTPLSKIWIYEEDQVSLAEEYLKQFQQNPDDSTFAVSAPPHHLMDVFAPQNEEDPFLKNAPPKKQSSSKQTYGLVTLYILLLCTLLFVWGKSTAPQVEPFSPIFPPTPLFSPLINKMLLFDYPKAYTLVDRLVKLYGLEKLQTPDELPVEGQFLLVEYLRTPYWKGLYEKLLLHWAHPELEWNLQEPLFEKIRQGEVWRLISPCLLHQDIFHIVFNMIWLLTLGRQMESKLGPWRYLLFMAIAAIISNTAQYLMSGANFIGYSGILCAMLTFIWMRQRHAGWEGYDLQRSTFALMMIFILSMFLIQLGSFFTELKWQQTLSPGIANTAHLTGAGVGLVLGRLHFFRWKG